ALEVDALRIGPHVEKIGPLLIIERRGITRTRDMRLAAVAELDFGPRFTATGTRDQQHWRTSVRNGRRCGLVDQPAGAEAVECERSGDRVRLAAGNGGREDMARAGRRLEPTRSPAAIDEQVRHGRLADDRRAVRRDIDDAAPI